MKASEIRAKWLQFFKSKGHHIEPSASLVPHNDPSLLWINAGMAPLKPYFDGRIKPDNRRIANSQKCIRTNDIEHVGRTHRHHTFFEMLGNFSIGDYFKEEAITWAWEFLTSKQWIGFDPQRLYVTTHYEDEETYRLWHTKIGLPADHIIPTETDNFWDIGEGPCGPCTEIFYDRGEQYGTLQQDPACYPGGENERYLEVWNLVFSQYNHNKDGSYTPLPNKNIDTGAGLERLASILQNVTSNFDTDLFQPLIQATCHLARVQYFARADFDVALKVIADHIRTVIFAISDDVLPANEGRGYVIRRLLRRAIRYGKLIHIDEPFLYKLVQTVCDVMGEFYREIREKRVFIEQVVKNEEERFRVTLLDGLALLAKVVATAKQEGRMQITGQEAFKLYDTYGFPLDLTEDYAAEHGLKVDGIRFEQAMQGQRARARAARQNTSSMQVQDGALSTFTAKSEFVGYDEWVTTAQVVALIVADELCEQVNAGTTCQLLLDRTPFYAESGGQVGDTGRLLAPDCEVKIENVILAPHGQHVAIAYVQTGTLYVGMSVQAEVSYTKRADISKNHTATHLLHKALKLVLGDHVNQAGSLVKSERLRFDFTHIKSVTDEELVDIERRVNEQIWDSIAVHISSKSLHEAKASGAMALFGEKYGEIVRLVQIGDYSLELCGGCHVKNTAEIGLFKIISENGIGSGIRRIEAVTAQYAYLYIEEKLALLKQVGKLLKTKIPDIPQRIESLLMREKEVMRVNESLQSKLCYLEASQLITQVKMIDGRQQLIAKLDVKDMDALRLMADELKRKLPEAIIVLAAANEEKVNFVVVMAPQLVKQGLDAGKLVKKLATLCGGSGGGRPDMAQAGGKCSSQLEEVLLRVDDFIAQQLQL